MEGVTSERLVTRVGAVSLAVMAAAIVFFVFVFDQIEWGSRDRIRVYFHRAGGLREGAALVVGGRTIGHVESIALASRAKMLDGDDGVVVTVTVDRKAASQVGRGGDVFVSSRGALSERYLEIGPAAEPGRPYQDGDEIRGNDPPSVDDVLNHTWANMLVFQRFADRFRPELADLRAQVLAAQGNFNDISADLGDAAKNTAPLIDRARVIAADVQHIREVSLGGRAGADRLNGVVDHARTTIAQARAMVAELRVRLDALQAAVDRLRDRIDAASPQLAAKLDEAIARGKAALDKIDPMLVVVDEIADRLRRGEGTIGKIANDPEFPEDAKELGKILKREPWRVIGHPQD